MRKSAASTIAAVTQGLVEDFVNEWPKRKDPDDYVYEQFAGFPGFWVECGYAGIALDNALREDRDFISCVDTFVARLAKAWLTGDSPDYDRLAKACVEDADPGDCYIEEDEE